MTELIGNSSEIAELREEVACLKRSDAKVLITGESGVGKEVLAKAIHGSSARASAKLVSLNCAGVAESLLESELFGHAKGSFTGAYRDKQGLLELGNHGTVFLDEIGEMSLRMQALLLRFLESGEIQPVGSVSPRHSIDVRIISATNRYLPEQVESGGFRRDLYYRLSVVTLRVPPLRERTEDLPLLAANALRQAREAGARATTISEEALAVLNQYEWPGNVRELENTIAHAALYARGNVITPDDLPAKIRKQSRPAGSENKTQAMFKDLPSLDEMERRYVIHVLQTVGGSRTRAAEVLGIDRRTLYRMAERFGINLKEGGE